MRPAAPPGAFRSALALAGAYLCAPVLGLAGLVALFQTGVLGGVEILFYRGVALTGLSSILVFGVVLLAGRRRRSVLRVRDAFAAAVMSFGLNLGFLVLLPVTVDRSISVFLLGRFAAAPDGVAAPAAVEEAFARAYLAEQGQLRRRFAEQVASGNLERLDDGTLRLTARGRAFMAFARDVARAFHTDLRLVEPAPDPARAPQGATR